MLDQFNAKLEVFLNSDGELARRLEGFKSFSGTPDRHYRRARQQGISAVARAVKCYPFGGGSYIQGGPLVEITVPDLLEGKSILISLNEKNFSVQTGHADNPYLSIGLSKELFREAVLGRHRWLFLMGKNDVRVSCADGLPHSDWITILEVLVALQELAEFDAEVWDMIERL